MKFDMNKAWSRAIVLVRENFQLLAVIAGLFLLLPSIAVYLLLPDLSELLVYTDDPDAMRRIIESILDEVLLIGLVSVFLQFISYGAMVALMGFNRPTVGEALAIGAKSALSIFCVLLIFLLAFIGLAMITVLPLGMLMGLIAGPAAPILTNVAMIGLLAYLFARFCMVMPATVVEGVANPIKAISRSWQLTSADHWRIAAFWTVLGAAYIVISLLIGGLAGASASFITDPTLAAFVLGLTNGVISMAVGMVMCGLAVAIHRQLSGPSAGDIKQTFD
jgi:hypothetical protein